MRDHPAGAMISWLSGFPGIYIYIHAYIWGANMKPTTNNQLSGFLWASRPSQACLAGAETTGHWELKYPFLLVNAIQYYSILINYHWSLTDTGSIGKAFKQSCSTSPLTCCHGANPYRSFHHCFRLGCSRTDGSQLWLKLQRRNILLQWCQLGCLTKGNPVVNQLQL